jgi:nucleoside-diphosphate-sugar epimerase
MSVKILITGGSGFIGSHLVKLFISAGYEVASTKRNSTSYWRLEHEKKNIRWINISNKNWKEKVVDFNPVYIIHCSWDGVTANQRENDNIQLSNFSFLIELLEICNLIKPKKFITLGSQAEYGFFDHTVKENYIESPTNMYGHTKLISKHTVEFYCNKNNIEWIWLRLFPFFGENESFEWFIPMITKKILLGELIEMTPGEQEYAYLYVGDFAVWMKKIVENKIEKGVYNISSMTFISLKKLVYKICKYLNKPQDNIKFGAISYRSNQSMLMCGNIEKLKLAISTIEETNFDINLHLTIDNLINRINKND